MPKKGYVADIEKLTVENADFRRVLYTGQYLQLVLMALKPGEEIGEEVHDDRDQFFRVEEGSGTVHIDGAANPVKDDDIAIVPAGARHNVIAGPEGLKVYTLYGPPEHRLDVVHHTRPEAEKDEEHWDGRTTE